MCSNSVHWVPISKIKGGKPIFGWESLLSQQADSAVGLIWQWCKPQSLSFWHRDWNSTSWFPQRSEQMIPDAFLLKNPQTSARSFCVYFLKRDSLLNCAYCNGFVLGCIILTGLVGNDISPFLFLAVLGIWCIYSASKGFCICTWEYLSCHNNRGLRICR